MPIRSPIGAIIKIFFFYKLSDSNVKKGYEYKPNKCNGRFQYYFIWNKFKDLFE